MNILPNARILYPGTIIGPQGRIMASTWPAEIFFKVLGFLQINIFTGKKFKIILP